MTAQFRFDSSETQDDVFSIDVHPPLEPLELDRTRLALFDPAGETETLLKSMAISSTRITAQANLKSFDVLIIRRKALSLDGPLPDIRGVREGLRVVFFEQASDVLEKRLGFRVQEYGLREVFPRVNDHPVLNDIFSVHLHASNGEATLLPPRLSYEMRPMHGPTVRWCDFPVAHAWRCGNRGNVASVLIEKPTCGNFLPLVDGGFSLQYSPFLEYREGKGMALICQLDVTSRTQDDPAARKSVLSMIQHVAQHETSAPSRPVVYVGESAGLQHLHACGTPAVAYRGENLPENGLLVVGPEGSSALSTQIQQIAAWLKSSGRILTIGLDDSELAFLPGLPRSSASEHIATVFSVPEIKSPFAGVCPADVHNRDAQILPLISSGASRLGDGVLATSDEARSSSVNSYASASRSGRVPT